MLRQLFCSVFQFSICISYAKLCLVYGYILFKKVLLVYS